MFLCYKELVSFALNLVNGTNSNLSILAIGESSKEYLGKVKEQPRRELDISDGMQGSTARRVESTTRSMEGSPKNYRSQKNEGS